MWIKFILLLCLTIHIYAEVHHPQVYEDQAEHVHNRNENIRIARNPETTYRTIHQPPTFSYDAAKQQDYLRRRYSQQQKIDLLRMSNPYSKEQKFLSQPINLAMNDNQVNYRVQRSKNNKEVWQQFSPLTTKQEPAASGDLDAEGSEVIEDKQKIDRQDSPRPHEQMIYMNPNLLKQNFKENSQQQIRRNHDSNIKKPDTQLMVLNELIGKNPNVQLEGLKRLLQDTPTQNFMMPVVRGPQPFQLRDHTPIAEKLVDIPHSQNIPNIQVNHLEQTIIPPQIPQIPHIVNKESLADLQKQFDEHSRIQTQQVLARAQQEAQAHVEAQHKAIALAQAQAQKTALENIQKSLYVNSPAVPEVQQNIQAEALVRAQPRPPNISPVLTNKVQNPPIVKKQPLPTNVQHETPLNDHPPQASTYTHVINLPPANIATTATHNNIPVGAYNSKDLLYYAPNHQHQQAVAQGQVNLAHIHNNAVLHAPLVGQHEINIGAQTNIEDDSISGINSLAHPEPTATTYQHFALEANSSEQEDHDDVDELQYAAKYAFGYRIKDGKEGNDFGHEERRNGKSAEGSYHVLLPDGRLQKVQYYADNSGYHAKVTYEHVGHH